MRLSALLAIVFGVPALALQRRDDEYKGNGKPYEDPADKGGRMLTVSYLLVTRHELRDVSDSIDCASESAAACQAMSRTVGT